MNSRNDWLDDLQRNISELIAKSPAADIERNVKAMMAQTFSRLDLVTREEFDVQKELLERLFERVAALELRIQALESPQDLADAATSDKVDSSVSQTETAPAVEPDASEPSSSS